VAPGAVLTNFQKASKAPPGFSEAFLPMIPIKRFTTTQDIANAVVFLSSDVSSDLVGQTIAVDGGLTMY
jgi:NAD(P)-dependent dehydrogenase (short-subunit alcohol dehydrogenase family)